MHRAATMAPIGLILGCVPESSSMFSDAPPIGPVGETEKRAEEVDGSQRFQLVAEQVRAEAAGPVLVKLSLTYLGDEPIEYGSYTDLLDGSVDADAPPSWKRKVRPLIRVSASFGCRDTLSKNDTRTWTVDLKNTFDIIPSGEATLVFRWHMAIKKVGAEGEDIPICPRTTLKVKI